MSGEPLSVSSPARARPVLRYAIGATLILTVAVGADYLLSYLTAVMALNLMAPGSKPLTFKQAFALIASLIGACLLGIVFSRLFLEYQIVFILLLGLFLFFLYYLALPALIKLWLLVALVLIPFLASFADAVSLVVAYSLVKNAFMAVILVWVAYLLFPVSEPLPGQENKPALKSSRNERFVYAIKSIIVVFPVVVAFFFFRWNGAILILIFTVMLSLNPNTTTLKTGKFMILANILGGVAAILVFELLVVVPEYLFFVLMTLLSALLFARKIFSGIPSAPLYASAFSTFLLVLGTVTTSDDGAGAKVWSRVSQISVAVIYIVLSYTAVNAFFKYRSKEI